MTYENARPARALIVAGRSLGSTVMVDLGLGVLDWLIAAQTADEGHLSPVGNGWWTRGEAKAMFDQQPIEATSLLLAAETALAATGDPRYGEVMDRAYAWFLGANDLGIAIADPARGASFDGLTPTGANTNQGAESTLMWLTALEHIRAVREPGVEAIAGVRRARCAGRVGAAARRVVAVSQHHDAMLFQRSAANPILTAERRPLPVELRVQSRRGPGRGRDDPARAGRGPARHLAAPRRAQPGWRVGLAVRSRAAPALRRRALPRGDSGAARTRA